MNKNMVIDFINYGIIASVFLIIPYNNLRFIVIIIGIIYDLIKLYFIERKEKKNEL